jgi:hypothetical protein
MSLLVLAAVLLVASCGSKTPSPAASTPDWATSVCTALNAWTTSIGSAVDSVRPGSISITSLQSVADDVKSANQNLAYALKNVGEPNTSAGGQAKGSLDRFLRQATTEQDKISTAVNEAWGSIPLPDAIPTAAPVVLGSLKALGTAVSTTFGQLETLDAPGELSRAFKHASACHAENQANDPRGAPADRPRQAANR